MGCNFLRQGIFLTQESNRASCTAVRERASERWTGRGGRRWGRPKVRRADRGAWRPGTGSRALDDRRQSGRPVQGRLPSRSRAPPCRAACETRQRLRAVRSLTRGSHGRRQTRGRTGGGERELGHPEASDLLSSDVAGRSGGRETPETPPRGAGLGGSPWRLSGWWAGRPAGMEAWRGRRGGGRQGAAFTPGPVFTPLPTFSLSFSLTLERPPDRPPAGRLGCRRPSAPFATEVSLLPIPPLALVMKCF